MNRSFFLLKLGGTLRIFEGSIGSDLGWVGSGDLWAGRTPSLGHVFSIAPVVINCLEAPFEVRNALVGSSTRLTESVMC